MDLIYKHNLGNGHIYEETICKVDPSVCTSIRALRLMLATHATRKNFGFEGRDWKFITNSSRCMIPFYISSTDGTLTLEIL